MNFHMSNSEVYCWDGSAPSEALAKTTHLGIFAHQDDLEIAAIHGILECFQREDRSFSGVVVTDGGGSAREFDYASYTDEQMRAVRRREQKKAAHVGEYAAQVLLDYPSRMAKQKDETQIVEDIRRIIELARPEVVYTHNLCDQHDTHVAVALKVVQAIRSISTHSRPKQFVGCEVWGDLDWLPREYRVEMDVSGREHLATSLLGVFDSQIRGGKRYDLASLGRRRAHATFAESHSVDRTQSVVYGMDLQRLLDEPELKPGAFVESMISEFSADVGRRIQQFAAS